MYGEEGKGRISIHLALALHMGKVLLVCLSSDPVTCGVLSHLSPQKVQRSSLLDAKSIYRPDHKNIVYI